MSKNVIKTPITGIIQGTTTICVWIGCHFQKCYHVFDILFLETWDIVLVSSVKINENMSPHWDYKLIHGDISSVPPWYDCL